MVHVIIVNKDEAREIVLTALRDKGYSVTSERVGETVEAAQTPDQCNTCCSTTKMLEVLERLFEKNSGARSFYRFALNAIEKPMIEKALAKTGGNQLAAARMLGVNRNTIRSKIRRLAIRVPERKQEGWAH